jgi:hypothetical protein
MKTAIAAALLSSCMCLPAAHADQFSWVPNVNQGYNFKAGSIVPISGKAHVEAYNDSLQSHTYTYMLGVYTDCGANINNTGLYTTQVTIQPGQKFIEDRTVSGNAKCNNYGTHKVTLTVGFSNNGGSQYYQQQFGYIHGV